MWAFSKTLRTCQLFPHSFRVSVISETSSHVYNFKVAIGESDGVALCGVEWPQAAWKPAGTILTIFQNLFMRTCTKDLHWDRSK